MSRFGTSASPAQLSAGTQKRLYRSPKHLPVTAVTLSLIAIATLTIRR